ncbi:undecaprenyl-phosphate glucose phosphotransferase [Vibrio gazogenes]|uniref:Putative colanic acid biosysnthesis UDP-glucose lipid carrier transferase n=1 Tax=Vibrio gazogenes DSM 21264 = NBRC 103151 TaxID=1123492 RepID=A0A1M5E9W1_VIBGA|nr:undecaprenyl-phosphate glucose phosphotransferase [Vibrio gazogenes]USP14290.1 undecaprenyl-phosphate glucose phosphotransferase [Vibrio gazogenes]SHF75924.1 putative colanic acid biosysnthesis UDP-glucose lipid carrier transferase [Vibrio gazogenes DSM 21264] [Vibrio gazogenes DSM 21264 = NBRC 103151]SJN58715.1 UDP-glucose:undecaprenyl-phosphate glucose-1-phosphate transferase [Vibrio gazogenes]
MGYGSRIKYYGEESSVGFKVVDIFVISMILFLVSESYLDGFTTIYQLILSFFAVVYFVISDVAGVYRPYKYLSFKQNFFAIVMTWSVCVALSLIVAFFLKISEDYSRLVIGLWFGLTPFFLVGWRWLVHGMFRVIFPGDKHRSKAIIIGATGSGLQLAQELKQHRSSREVLIGFYDDRSLDRIGLHRLSCPLRGKIDDALMLAKSHSVQKVYIALPMEAAKRIKQILNAFADSNAHVYVVPDFFTFDLMQSRLKNIGKVVTLSVYDTPFYGFTSLIKRIEDIILASIIITLISPVLLFVAIGVKLSSPGPIIFKQERYGLDGKPIKVWKFRSMRAMDNGSVVKQATKNDPRVTQFGAFIRRTSLDELPQFINVITGQMSIVGPRPHAVAHNEEYRGLIDKYMLRHHVKPGITGWAQINGYRGETDTLDKMEKRVEFDLSYIQTWSLWLDLKIIFLTVFKGFVGKTAY